MGNIKLVVVIYMYMRYTLYFGFGKTEIDILKHTVSFNRTSIWKPEMSQQREFKSHIYNCILCPYGPNKFHIYNKHTMFTQLITTL